MNTYISVTKSITTEMSEGNTRTSQPIPDRKKLCVWLLPNGSPPAVRVAAYDYKMPCSVVFNTACKAIGLQERSKPFFALFKGLDPVTKKYGTEENVYLPCKFLVSIQKWCFDIVAEARVIKTDAVAFRMIAHQISADLKSGRWKLSQEDEDMLADSIDTNFMCHKQYVELARTLPEYDTVSIIGVVLTADLKLKRQTVKKDTVMDVVCSDRKMKLITGKRCFLIICLYMGILSI